MQINATRYHHTPIKIAKIKKKLTKLNAGKDMEKLETQDHLYMAGGI